MSESDTLILTKEDISELNPIFKLYKSVDEESKELASALAKSSSLVQKLIANNAITLWEGIYIPVSYVFDHSDRFQISFIHALMDPDLREKLILIPVSVNFTDSEKENMWSIIPKFITTDGDHMEELISKQEWYQRLCNEEIYFKFTKVSKYAYSIQEGYSLFYTFDQERITRALLSRDIALTFYKLVKYD